MNDFPQPVVLLSKCIEFAQCRYNGLMISSDVVKALKKCVRFIPVCPEVEIGLGVPRDPIRVVAAADGFRLLQPSTRIDVTARMRRFAASFLASLPPVDGFILKGRSPSCGLRDVKVFSGADEGAASAKGAGFFGGAVSEEFPGYPAEDEGRLLNFRIREHFLTSLWALAAFRAVARRGGMKDLVDYHARNKFLLMSYHQKEMRVLGRIVANPEKKGIDAVFADYETHLRAALASPARYSSNVNVLMHALGYFSDWLSRSEKAFFLETLERYRAGRIPLSAALSVVSSWLARFDNEYLRSQTFFAPYPEALVEITDSGKGRDL